MNDEMKTICTCPVCKKEEYYGMLHWKDGQLYCRHCIQELWNKEAQTFGKKQFENYYPLYEDGKDYSK